MFQEIVIPYIICGALLGFGFEVLIDKTEKPTQWWERIFWVTCWPYCLTIFLWGMFKN